MLAVRAPTKPSPSTRATPPHLVADVAAQRKRLVVTRVLAGGIHVADVHLDGRMVLGGDQAPGPRALPRDVQVHGLASIVLHPADVLLV